MPNLQPTRPNWVEKFWTHHKPVRESDWVGQIMCQGQSTQSKLTMTKQQKDLP